MIFHILGDPPGLNTGQIIGIVIGILTGIFVIGIFGWIYGKPYWEKRHNYGWYNTLTTPSDWCDCDCFSSSDTRQSNDSSVSCWSIWGPDVCSSDTKSLSQFLQALSTGYVRSGTQPASNTTATFVSNDNFKSNVHVQCRVLLLESDTAYFTG